MASDGTVTEIALSPVTFDLGYGLNLDNVRRCADFASLAYINRPTFYDPVTDTKVLIQRCTNAIVISFQGTKDWKQWIQDAKFWKYKDDIFPGVHTGIAEDYLAVAGSVRRAVTEEMTDLPLFITGHSKGAGEASLCAYDLCMRGFSNRIHSVTTFGQPRTGGGAYANKYNRVLADRTFRWQDAEDIVTRLPRIGFRHHERCYFVNSSDQVIVDPSLTTLFWSDVRGILRELRHGRAALIDDHFMTDYHAVLKNLKLSDLFYYRI